MAGVGSPRLYRASLSPRSASRSPMQTRQPARELSPAAMLRREHLIVVSPRTRPPHPSQVAAAMPVGAATPPDGHRHDPGHLPSYSPAPATAPAPQYPSRAQHRAPYASPPPPPPPPPPRSMRPTSPMHVRGVSPPGQPDGRPPGRSASGAAGVPHQHASAVTAEVVFSAVRRHWYAVEGLPHVVGDVMQELGLASATHAVSVIETVLGAPLPDRLLEAAGIRRAVSPVSDVASQRGRSRSPLHARSCASPSPARAASPAARAVSPQGGVSSPNQRHAAVQPQQPLQQPLQQPQQPLQQQRPPASLPHSSSVAEAIARRWAAFAARDLEGVVRCYTERSAVHAPVEPTADVRGARPAPSLRVHKGLEGVRRYHRALMGSMAEGSGLRAHAPQIDESIRHAVIEWECPGIGIIRAVDTLVYDEQYQVVAQSVVLQRQPAARSSSGGRPAAARKPARKGVTSPGPKHRATAARRAQQKERPEPEPFSSDPRLWGKPLSESPCRTAPLRAAVKSPAKGAARTPRRATPSRAPPRKSASPAPAKAAHRKAASPAGRSTPPARASAVQPPPLKAAAPAPPPAIPPARPAVHTAPPAPPPAPAPDAPPAAPPAAPSAAPPAAPPAAPDAGLETTEDAEAGSAVDDIDAAEEQEQHNAATKIQTNFRARSARRNVKEMQESRQAATTLQRTWRGKVARDKMKST
eukprot:TRINITY_DN4924_c0_g4_i2.p1 TRINITY_DN4924_c0_g4~~TRINITY_DN4924_c0_g4_i2.p1  ORF type:complete len:717 (+),score=123.41 TRINITY_DN4924_c0_g4_i2:63-2153(+)